MSVAQISFDPSVAGNFNDLTPQFRPGTVYEHPTTGRQYRYVRHDNGAAVASANGGAAYWSDYANAVVSSDKTDNQMGATIPAGVAGIYQGVVTDRYFTWLVIKGSYTTMLAAADANGAVGNRIFAPASDADLRVRSEADSSVAAAEIPATEIGRQLAAGAADAALVLLNIP